MSLKFLNENLENVCMSVISESEKHFVLNEKKENEDDSEKDSENEDDENDKNDEDDAEDGDSGNPVKSIFGGNVDDSSDDGGEGSDDDDSDEDDETDEEDQDAENSDEDGDDGEDESETDAETDVGEGGEDEEEEDEEDGIGSGTEGLSDLKEFGVRIMMFATLAHFWHLNCDKNSQHSALDDLYNDVTDDADKIIESILSYTGGKILSDDGDEFDFGTLDFRQEDDIDLMKELRDDASSLAQDYGDHGGIANELGDLCEHLDKAIYKLSQFSC